MVDWKLLLQRNKTQINKDSIYENNKIVDHDQKVRDKIILNNNTAYKYETPYKVPFVIIILQCGATKIKYNIHGIKPYTSDTNIEDIKF